MIDNYKILQPNFKQQYINLFQQYYITTVYGDEIIMGSDLVHEEE